MRLLLDENVALRVRAALAAGGHDTLHVADLHLLGAPDDAVLAAAADERRTLITADTDFGTLLAVSQTATPSVLLLRRGSRRAEQRAEQILFALDTAGPVLESGALVVVESGRLRIRRLLRKRGMSSSPRQPSDRVHR
ncbi:MAG: DUF5615 family PIN-like protein [Euzebyales bacterium]|nr:DUF5615 family PIN-like protein [Euzebyales bacterium]